MIVPMVSPTGLYTKESVVSTSRPPCTSVPPPVKIKVPMVVVGIYARAAGKTAAFNAQVFAVGVNS